MTNILNDKYIFVMFFIIFPPPISKDCTSNVKISAKNILAQWKYLLTAFSHPFLLLANVVASASQFSCPLGMEGAVKRSYLKFQIFKMTNIVIVLIIFPPPTFKKCTFTVGDLSKYAYRPFKSTTQSQILSSDKVLNFYVILGTRKTSYTTWYPF